MAMETTDVYRRIQGPLSLASLLVCVFGLAVSWILITLGITLYFDMAGFDTRPGVNLVSTTEALQVSGLGIVVGVIAILGWKGFMRFAY